MSAQEGKEGMKQSITRLIRPKGDRLVTANSSWREASYVRNRGVYVPKRPYRVTFTLDPKGTMQAWTEWVQVNQYSPHLGGYVVCFLPHEWVGQRITRTVRTLDAKA